MNLSVVIPGRRKAANRKSMLLWRDLGGILGSRFQRTPERQLLW